MPVLLNAFAPIVFNEAGKYSISKDEHDSNAEDGIEIKFGGNFRNCRAEQLKKHFVPNVDNVFGKFVILKEEQFLKASIPIDYNANGRYNNANLVHPENA